MPAPYSDNLYSAADSDIDLDQDEALSPADGYFRASASSHPASSHFHQDGGEQYPGVPSVPNVMVEDPTLREQDATSKAREAAEESRLNSPQGHGYEVNHGAAVGETSSRVSPGRTQATPYTHHHRRSVEDDTDPSLFTGSHQNHRRTSGSYTSRHHSSAGETVPLLPHSDAPPAYSPASPTSPPTASSQAYQTIGQGPQPRNNESNGTSSSEMGSALEQQRLLPESREPESMVGASSSSSSSRDVKPWQRLWRRCKGPLATRDARRRATRILGILLIISIVCGIFGISLHSPTSHHYHGDIELPEVPAHPERPGDLYWSPPTNCYDSPHSFPKINNRVDFYPGHNLSIIQNIESRDGSHSGRQPHVGGELILKPTDENNYQESGQIEIEVTSNHPDLQVLFAYDEHAQEFVVTVPRSVEWDVSSLSPCIQIRITVWVPPRAALDALNVELVHLDVKIVQGLRLSTERAVYIATAVGKISAPTISDGQDSPIPYELNARQIEITSVSDTISGWYPLYDLLRIRSASGDVKVDIGPKAVLLEDPRPATLEIYTVSGVVAATTLGMRSELPPRDYVAVVETVSGDVRAELPFTSQGRFVSQSGKLDLTLRPVLDVEAALYAEKTQLITDTKSGDTNVTVQTPLWTSIARSSPVFPERPNEPIEIVPIGDDDPYLIIHPDLSEEQEDNNDDDDDEQQTSNHATRDYNNSPPPLSSLRSEHSSVSGHIVLRYPSAWEGKLRADSISGSQSFRGDGLHVFKKLSGLAHVLEGYKGHGNSYLSVHTISGGEDFVVGAGTG